MKTGNGRSPNPTRKFGATPRKENSNVVKPKAPVQFSGKRDSFKGKSK